MTTLQTAARALQSGDLGTAEASCRALLAADPANAGAMQVLAMTQHRLGRLEDAEALFARSVALAPRNAEFRTNFALLLAARNRREESLAELERALVADPRFRPARLALARMSNEAGRHEAAAAHARKLIAANAQDSEAWSALGTALFESGRRADARAAFERAVEFAPGYGAARYKLAVALCEEERAEEALAHAEEAARLGVTHRELFLTRARALMQLDRYDEAETLMAPLVTSMPYDIEMQFLLAQLRHVRGDTDFAGSLREASSRHDAPVEVGVAYADTLRRAGNYPLAERVLRDLWTRSGPRADVSSSLAVLLQECGRPAEAAQAARQAAIAKPDDPAITETLVAALLSAGEPREALPIVDRLRAATPHDQRWITYRADIARQCGEDLFGEWCDFENLVRVYDPPPPPGYSTMDEFHAELRPILDASHRHSAHPLTQSMRNGTQSSRGLSARSEPAVTAFFKMLDEMLEDYQRTLGRDPGHPLRARNVMPARLAGCWSVCLRRGGFHVNHIHPQGWVSSAYYVSLPREVDDVSLRSGWIKFGEPRFPMPNGAPARFVRPREGRLVLFPSYMWHGTEPICGAEPRLTIAFDAVPTAAR